MKQLLKRIFKKKPKTTKKLNMKLIKELKWSTPEVHDDESIARVNVLLKLEKILSQENTEVD